MECGGDQDRGEKKDHKNRKVCEVQNQIKKNAQGRTGATQKHGKKKATAKPKTAPKCILQETGKAQIHVEKGQKRLKRTWSRPTR